MKSPEKRIKTLPLLIVSLSVIAVAVVTLVLLLLQRGGDTAGSSSYDMPAKPRFIYAKNKVLYMYDDGTSERMSEDICNKYTLTADNNRLIYLSYGDLWYRDIESKDNKPHKIAPEVAAYNANSDGSKIVYIKENGDIFTGMTDGKTTKVGENCSDSDELFINDSGDRIAYFTNDSKFILADILQGNEIINEPIGGNSTVRCSGSLSVIIIGRHYYVNDEPVNNIYIYSDNGKTKNVIENAETVRAYPEKNSMYYIKDDTLYYYEKGESTKILDDYSCGYYSFELCAADVPVMVIPEGSGFFVAKKDKTEKIKFDLNASCVMITTREISADGNTLIFTASGDGDSKIYRLDLSDGSDKTPVAIDDDTDVTRITLTSDKKVVYSKTEYGSPMRNIYVDGKLIAENADSDNITYLDGSFYYIKNTYGTDEEEPASVLTINTDGKETAIKDDVTRYCVLDNDNIMMICGMDREDDFPGGTLYLYKDGKIVKIDEEVTSIETAVKRYDKIDLDYYSMQ